MGKIKCIKLAFASMVFPFFILVTYPLLAQNETRTVHAKYITEQIHLDGVLDEAVWGKADKADNFWQYFPNDSVRAELPTEVKILYNDHTLYAGIRAETSGDVVVANLRRDFSGTANDNVSLVFDTYSDGTHAYMFGVTPYGVQREVQISEGGETASGFNANWDEKWRAESKMYEHYYTAEVAIPLTSMKFKEGTDQWRFRPYRWDIQNNEQSTWVRVPQNQMFSSLAFMGRLKFEKPLGKSRTPVAIIPYMNALADKNYKSGTSDTQFRVGGDAKVAIGQGMNLDLTINPDFSNVEVDDIFTNLTRFEVSLPEKRQFFIDNSDLFGNYGDRYNAANPFFSRRIGLARDTAGNLIENRILGGARLSGKLNEDWRLGFLNIQTDKDRLNEIPSNNNMMLSLQRKVFARSSIGVFAINRQTFQDYDFLDRKDRYNRVFGAEYNLASADNSWTGKFYLHKSLQPEDKKGNLSSQATVTYNHRKFSWTIDWMYVDEDFRADLGFVPRKGILKNGNGLSYNFYPSGGKISQHGPGLIFLYYWRPELDWKRSDHTQRLYYNFRFNNQSSLQLALDNRHIFLRHNFDPTRTEGAVALPGDKQYTFNQLTASYQSNPANLLSFNLEATGGEFYNGHNFTGQGEVTFRVQPWALFSLDVRYDNIRLPDPHHDADFWLVSPKIDITFSKSLFWSTLIQYSNQRENLGINSRLQWRFAPLSDLYLVYNDNYFTKDFGPRYRSINLKISYWLSI